MQITKQMLVITVLCLRWPTCCWTINETKFYYPFFDTDLESTVKFLRFEGSAAVNQDLKVVELTGANDAGVFGAVARADAVPIYDPDTVLDNITCSFTFVFQLDISSNGTSGISKGGTGVLFFMASNITNLGNPAYHWGMLPTTAANDSDDSDGTVFGVEFDTHLDNETNDPDDNHIGLDFNQAKSLLTCPLKDLGIIMDGSLMTTWIEYSSFRKRIDISVSLTDVKPYDSLCYMENFDIRNYVKEKTFVGFSALGNKTVQQHQVAFWTAETYAWRAPPPPPSPPPPPPPSPPPPPPTVSGRLLEYKDEIAVAVGGYSMLLGPLFEVGIVFFFLRITDCGQRKMVSWYEALDKSLSKEDPPSKFKKAWQCCCGLWICVMFCTLPRPSPEEIAAREVADKKMLVKCGCGWLARLSATPKSKSGTTLKTPKSPKGRGRRRGKRHPPAKGKERGEPPERRRGPLQLFGRGRGRGRSTGRGQPQFDGQDKSNLSDSKAEAILKAKMKAEE